MANTDDPAVVKAIGQFYQDSDNEKFIQNLRTLGASGSVGAQLFLGNIYERSNNFLSEPDLSESLKWFRLASAGGSGEASEHAAQIIEELPATPNSASEAKAYHALAIQRGWDLQTIEARCYRLLHNQAVLHCSDSTKASDCPSEEDLESMRQAGLTGTLIKDGGSGRSHHPGTIPASAILVFDHPITGEVRLPQPSHTAIIYLQQAEGWKALPAGAPTLSRDIILTPQLTIGPDSNIQVQEVDGSGFGGFCTVFPRPSQR